MRTSTVAKTLLVLGALVGGAAGVALALGLRADRLPPWMITVGMYKLAFIAAGGLLVAGALLGRAARRRWSRSGAPNDVERVRRDV
jgi:membrane protein implicated in regulation of membrane protease activity